MNRDGKPLVELEAVSRYYGDQCAVENLSLQIERGEILGLLGPNGAGKSSTLSMIAGTLAPHGGRIRINGIDLLEQPDAAKVDIGYLPEVPPLQREQTVDEFLGFCARLHRIPAHLISERCAATKQRCGLNACGARLIGSLSKGYRQRLGIAQAVLHAPAVVILDEPTVGLDPNQIRDIRELIRQLGDQHGVILSTHILPEVQAVCGRVAVLHEGRLVLDRTLQDLQHTAPAARVRIRLRKPPATPALQALAGVQGVEARAADEFILVHDGSGEVFEALVSAACAQGWGLQELRPAEESLEALFVRLTLGERADAESA